MKYRSAHRRFDRRRHNPTIFRKIGQEVRRNHSAQGELAWQLGFSAGGVSEAKRAFARVAADDEKATTLRKLMNAYGPCLILMDEWVAYP